MIFIKFAFVWFILSSIITFVASLNYIYLHTRKMDLGIDYGVWIAVSSAMNFCLFISCVAIAYYI